MTIGPCVAFAQVSIVNGASYDSGEPLAPGSFAAMFGENLCLQTMIGNWIAPGQLPTTLGRCSILINGAAAMMSYASPGQINFIVPENTAAGAAKVTVMNGSQSVAGSMMIAPSGPGVFAMNGMGVGEGAMLHGTLWKPGPFSVTTNGHPTPVSIFMTGLDLSAKPSVSIGGLPVDVTFFGTAPGFAGLQQVNIVLPANMAGAGRAPLTVTSSGQTSNVTSMEILPTTAMMQGIPGWGSGMMVADNARRGMEVSYMAFNAVNNSVLVTDENDDVVRVLSLDSNSTTATITLPAGSAARAVAVNDAGTLAAVALSGQAAVALIDLSQNQAVAVIATGYYPSHVVFSGTSLLVTNGASGTVSMIDSVVRVVLATVAVGFGPSGIAANGNLAVVANMQAGTISLINLTDYTTSTIPLPAGSRPHEVAISPTTNTAVITAPMSGSILLLNLTTKAIASVDVGLWNAMGPGAVVTSGGLAYVASQMTAGVTVVDVKAAKVIKTVAVDPGPRALAVNAAKNQLLVMAQGTGTVDLVDLTSYAISARMNARDTEREGNWTLPLVQSITPNTAPVGTSFTLTINGSALGTVKNIEFHTASMQGGGMGGGMMSGGGMGPGMGAEDQSIEVSNFQVNVAGTEITASVQILNSASAGARQIRLESDRGEVMGSMVSSLFTVTQ